MEDWHDDIDDDHDFHQQMWRLERAERVECLARWMSRDRGEPSGVLCTEEEATRMIENMLARLAEQVIPEERQWKIIEEMCERGGEGGAAAR